VRESVTSTYRFYLADIGPATSFGFPTSPALSKQVLNYQLLPLIIEPYAFDVYLVDGRWRLACVLHANTQAW
jgi:hypothetical protein